MCSTGRCRDRHTVLRVFHLIHRCNNIGHPSPVSRIKKHAFLLHIDSDNAIIKKHAFLSTEKSMLFSAARLLSQGEKSMLFYFPRAGLPGGSRARAPGWHLVYCIPEPSGMWYTVYQSLLVYIIVYTKLAGIRYTRCQTHAALRSLCCAALLPGCVALSISRSQPGKGSC